MEKKSHYFIVGVFVSLSLLALTIFVIWLAGTHDSRNYHRYTIFFHDPVSGLKSGALVQYRGVDVGRVRDVRLSPERNDLIKVDIEIDDTTPIAKTSEASLATQGVTGLVFIDLTTPDGESSEPAIPAGEQYPVIMGKGTQLSKLFQDVPAISKQILEISNKLNSVLNDQNVAALTQTIQNVQSMSHDLNGLLSQDNIDNTSLALRNLSRTSENIDQLVARFNQTANKIDTAVNSLNEIVTDNKSNINKFTGSGLQQITDMSRETKDMARSVRRLADKLEQDPSALVYKPNYRGVEIKK